MEKEFFPDSVDDWGLPRGITCNCPNECDETVYHQEMTQVRARKKS